MPKQPLELFAGNRKLAELGAVLTFSRYRVAPPGHQAAQPRTTFQAPASRLSQAWLERALHALRPDEELAIQSNVQIGETVFHLYMIDYAEGRPLGDVLSAGDSMLSTYFAHGVGQVFGHEPPTVTTFHSGASYHQYAPLLFDKSEWLRFLGDALLLSPSGETPMVDVRWVGHALRKGYAALRWSHNTDRYLRGPGPPHELTSAYRPNLEVILSATGDLAESEVSYRRAADAGDTDAMFNLARALYERGNVAEAELWYQRAAEAGDTDAMFTLGNVLARKGGLRDAEVWYRQAAEMGHAPSMENLAILLEARGDSQGAKAWRRRAASATS